MAAKKGTFIKTTVNLQDEELRIVEEIAERRGMTLTDVIRSAIRTEGYINNAEKSGKSVLVQEPGGSLKQLAFNKI